VEPLPSRRCTTTLASSSSPVRPLPLLSFFAKRVVAAPAPAPWGVKPLSHRSCQNLVCLPFPNLISVQTLKSCCSARDSDKGCIAHGLVGCFHRSHYHLSRRARLNISRSRMPIPPSDLGRWTRFQFIRQ
jgi:hypothetical protein